MSVRALWLPYEVSDLEVAARFYTEHLGLAQVDGWERRGERGVVLRAADAAYVELVSHRAAGDPPPGGEGPVPLAFELADRTAVDAAHDRWRPADRLVPPHRYPRGHYGFEVAGPAGARLMVWSEE